MTRKHLMFSALSLLVLMASALLVHARQTTAPVADEQKVRKMLELSGAGGMGKQAADQMLAQFRRQMPTVPAEVWDEISREVRPEAFTDMIVPIYQRHFSSDEVDQLIGFYESPIGRKLVGEQQGIMRDSMGVAQQFGQQMAAKVQQKLQAKGIKTTK